MPRKKKKTETTVGQVLSLPGKEEVNNTSEQTLEYRLEECEEGGPLVADAKRTTKEKTSAASPK